jgi:hypothetical protein
MAATRIESVDWESSSTRVLLLSLGWLLAFGALGSIVAGVLIGMPILFLAGAAIGFSAWMVAQVVPEPVPVPVIEEVPHRPRSMARRYSGHRLPS